jgi:predicted transcriptional regulator
LNIHAAFSQPGQVLVDVTVMPDGVSHLVISRTLEGPQAGFRERLRRTALLLACDAAQAGETVYGEGGRNRADLVPVGPSCRLCERQGCLSRAEAPVTRPLGLDEMVTGLSVFDFQ